MFGMLGKKRLLGGHQQRKEKVLGGVPESIWRRSRERSRRYLLRLPNRPQLDAPQGSERYLLCILRIDCFGSPYPGSLTYVCRTGRQSNTDRAP